MESILISACLTGVECKYCGGSNALPCETLDALKKKYRLVPICPEVDGGLPTPREPSERIGDRVMSRSGRDVTAEYRRGAELALSHATENACRIAVLKEKSPSCGKELIYDGSFTGTLIERDGVTAELLTEHGIAVYGESEVSALLLE